MLKTCTVSLFTFQVHHHGDSAAPQPHKVTQLIPPYACVQWLRNSTNKRSTPQLFWWWCICVGFCYHLGLLPHLESCHPSSSIAFSYYWCRVAVGLSSTCYLCAEPGIHSLTNKIISSSPPAWLISYKLVFSLANIYLICLPHVFAFPSVPRLWGSSDLTFSHKSSKKHDHAHCSRTWSYTALKGKFTWKSNIHISRLACSLMIASTLF